MANFYNFFIVCCLVGCASTPRFVSLPESFKQHIQSTDGVVLHEQNALYAKLDLSHCQACVGPSFGLIGSLIAGCVDYVSDKRQYDKAQAQMEPLHSALFSYNATDMLHARILPILKNVSWVNIKKIDVVKVERMKNLCHIQNHAVQYSTADAVLFLRFDCFLSPNFDALIGKLYVEMHPVSRKLIQSVKNKQKIIYKTEFTESYSLLCPSKNIVENAKCWAERDGKTIRKALESVLCGVVHQFKSGICTPGSVSSP